MEARERQLIFDGVSSVEMFDLGFLLLTGQEFCVLTWAGPRALQGISGECCSTVAARCNVNLRPLKMHHPSRCSRSRSKTV